MQFFQFKRHRTKYYCDFSFLRGFSLKLAQTSKPKLATDSHTRTHKAGLKLAAGDGDLRRLKLRRV